MKLKGKRVVVTGACGFIGSHLVERLVEEGCNVKAFVFYNSFNSWGWLDSVPRGVLNDIDLFAGDVRDPYGVRTALKGMDVVFHLAALIGIPYSYHSPDNYVDTNIKGTLNILQASRDLSLDRIILTSTSEVYGTARYVPIDENHPRQAQSPYSATKIAADALADSFFRSFDLPVITARPFNTYGPRQSARAVIPTIVSQLMEGDGRVTLGSLFPTRDLNFVTDTCEGFVSLAACDRAVGREVNIGSGVEISIGNLIQLISEVMDKPAEILSDDQRKRPGKSEVERLVCNSTMLRTLTGWQPQVSLREGLTKTVEWFRCKEILSRYKSGIYNV